MAKYLYYTRNLKFFVFENFSFSEKIFFGIKGMHHTKIEGFTPPHPHLKTRKTLRPNELRFLNVRFRKIKTRVLGVFRFFTIEV